MKSCRYGLANSHGVGDFRSVDWRRCPFPDARIEESDQLGEAGIVGVASECECQQAFKATPTDLPSTAERLEDDRRRRCSQSRMLDDVAKHEICLNHAIGTHHA